MHWWIAAAGAATGGIAGGRLRAVAFRLSVGAGEPDRTACTECGHVLLGHRHWWRGRVALTGRCPACRHRLGAPPGVLEVTAAACAAAVTGAVGPRPEVLAFAFLALLGVTLAAIDLAVLRLPDRLVLPGYPILVGLLAVAALLDGEPARLGRALAAGALTGLAHLVLVLIRPDQLGLGDVKLAGLLGIALGWFGWPVVLAGATLAFVGCAVVGLVVVLVRRGGLRTAVPLGPFMVTGAVAAVLAMT